MVKKCKFCSAPLGENDKFCQSCGNPVTYDDTDEKSSNKFSSTVYIVIIIIILILLYLIFF